MDVDGDQVQDLVVACFNGFCVAVLPGMGDGTFGTATSYGFGQAYSAAVADLDGDGKLDMMVADMEHDRIGVAMGEGGTTVAVPTLPGAMVSLPPNYPNPFNPRTTIEFSLAKEGRANLAIFDLAGRRVRQLWDGVMEAGLHRRQWDGLDSQGRSLPSGVYAVRLVGDSVVRSRMITLVR